MSPARKRARRIARRAVRVAGLPLPGPGAGMGGEHGTSPRAAHYRRTAEARFYRAPLAAPHGYPRGRR